MDIDQIVSELRHERDRISNAIALLVGNAAGLVSRKVTTASKRGGRGKGLTPAGRRRLSEAMKRRWAERRKKG